MNSIKVQINIFRNSILIAQEMPKNITKTFKKWRKKDTRKGWKKNKDLFNKN